MKPPYLVEKKLPMHIKKYMEKHPKLDVGQLTDHLITNYKEYSRKIRSRFMRSVIKAYKYQLHCKGVDPAKIKLFFSDEDYRLNNIQPDTPSDNSEAIESKTTKRTASTADIGENNKIAKKPKLNKFYTLESPTLQLSLFPEFKNDVFLEAYHCLHHQLPSHHMISGPPKSGKSTFTRALAMELQANFLKSNAVDIMCADNCASIKYLFSIAVAKQPCLLLIEFGNMFRKDGNLQNENGQRYCRTIEQCMSDLKATRAKVCLFIEVHECHNFEDNFRTMFIEIRVPPLSQNDRLAIIKRHCSESICSEDTLDVAVETTPGYLAGDLVKLVKNVRVVAQRRKLNNAEANYNEVNDFTVEDFTTCISALTPTLMMEGFPSVPQTKLEDVGGLDDVKEIINNKITTNVRRFSSSKKWGKRDQSGILLWGPPGCGKTMIASAVANNANINFLSISSSELLNKYQGETERNIRTAFERAASVTPCILFFDEFDAMCPKRSKRFESGSKQTIVNTLLAKMQGIESRRGVYVMATTNKPQMIDPAVLRPGRFDTVIYIGLPNYEERIKIFKAILSKESRVANDVNYEELASNSEGFSPADCNKWCTEAARTVTQKVVSNLSGGAHKFDNVNREFDELPEKLVYMRHFVDVLEEIEHSVSKEEMEVYRKIGNKMSSVNGPFSKTKLANQATMASVPEIDSNEMDVCMF